MKPEIQNLGITEAQYTQMMEFAKTWQQSNIKTMDGLPLLINGFKEPYDDAVCVFAQVNTSDHIMGASIINDTGRVLESTRLTYETSKDSMIMQLIHMYAANDSNMFILNDSHEFVLLDPPMYIYVKWENDPDGDSFTSIEAATDDEAIAKHYELTDVRHRDDVDYYIPEFSGVGVVLIRKTGEQVEMEPNSRGIPEFDGGVIIGFRDDENRWFG